jgi:pimeloyl-ACP methyl ester carboxylesterase
MSHSTRRQTHIPCANHLAACVFFFFAASASIVGSVCLPGCQSNQWVQVRKTPANPLADTLNLVSADSVTPSERVLLFLRRNDLEKTLSQAPDDVLTRVQQMVAEEPSPETLYAYAELSYLIGRDAEHHARPAEALDLYGGAVAHAYLYLFDDRLAADRNYFDPQFRQACDLYNTALESALRLHCSKEPLTPGKQLRIASGGHTFTVDVVSKGKWHPEDFGEIRFVSDFELEGLKNHYRSFGLGVPLIVERRRHDALAEEFYPEGLAFPVTAFLRVAGVEIRADDADDPRTDSARPPQHRIRCTLELHDPLTTETVAVRDRQVPLQTDLSTPLAYFLGKPQLNDKALAGLGLLLPEQARAIQGLYLLEPYDPAKIPVIMVHGLMSSPVTWTEMFNDLRADPDLRSKYQFWFYLYPTGQPFWVSAAQMRHDLVEARQKLDPDHHAVALDQTVLVGHSMGGLLSRLQTLESEDLFWRLISDAEPEDLVGDPQDIEQLLQVLFFDPNPSIRRVVTIGTPHRGSDMANDVTTWLGRSFITIPDFMNPNRNPVIVANRELFRESKLLRTNTSVDSLEPNNPYLPTMLQSKSPPWVTYHNIVGQVPAEDGWTRWLTGSVAPAGDGVVSFASAHLDEAASEIITPASHTEVHRHARTVLEVRRILREHLEQVRHEYRTGSDPRGAEILQR